MAVIADHQRTTDFDPLCVEWVFVSTDMLEIPPRVSNALRRANISTVAEIDAMQDADLLKLKGFGVGSLQWLRDAANDARLLWQANDRRFIELLDWDRAHMRSTGFVEYIPEGHHSPFCSKAFGPLEDCPVCCDSGSDRNGGDALAAPCAASQSGGTEGAASPTP